MYTVWSNVSGDLIAIGVSLESAALLLLQDDGAEFEIVEHKLGVGYALMIRNRNGDWHNSVAFSAAVDRDEAEQEIYAQVITTRGWSPSIEVMTDANFADIRMAQREDEYLSGIEIEGESARRSGGETFEDAVREMRLLRELQSS